MKKIIFILGVLFSINGYSQTTEVLRNDTTFFQGRRKDNGHKNGIWYQRIVIEKQFDDSASMVKFNQQRQHDIKSLRRYRRINRVGIGAFVLFNVIMLIKFN